MSSTTGVGRAVSAFFLPARFILRVKPESSLEGVETLLSFLRFSLWALSLVVMSLVLHITIGFLPGGWHIAMIAPLMGLTISTCVWTCIMPCFFLRAKTKTRKGYGIQAGCDAVVLAPLVMAATITVGRAGMPSSCRRFVRWSQTSYRSWSKRADELTDCGEWDAEFDEYYAEQGEVCGYADRVDKTRAQFHDICGSGKAIFALLLVLVFMTYFTAAVAAELARRSVKQDMLPLANLPEQTQKATKEEDSNVVLGPSRKT